MNSHADSQSDVINRDELVDRMMGSIQMAERMLAKFLAASDAECDELESIVRIGDAEELIRLAHRHKGTAKTMSARRVAAAAARLEQGAAREPTSELLQMIEEIRTAHRELRAAVRNGLATESTKGT
jgi:HPt (histidine-containing phosphotransfer) domain-containing protein